MLVVMAIIGIVAALVVGMSVTAKTKQRISQVQSDLNKVRHMIDNYQAKLNFYPPDNGGLINNTVNFQVYDAMAATNPLLYELTGAVNSNNNNIYFYDGSSEITNIYFKTYNLTSVMNANIDEPHDFFQPGPKTAETNAYGVFNGATGVLKGLVVPVDGPGPNNTLLTTNFWHYDCSTTNRHNANSYDLWAEFVVGSKNGQNVVLTNGNF